MGTHVRSQVVKLLENINVQKDKDTIKRLFIKIDADKSNVSRPPPPPSSVRVCARMHCVYT